MVDSATPLDEFRHEVMMNLSTGAFDLDVVDADGRRPVIVALDNERLSALMRRVAMIGGYANVFAKGDELVRQVSVIRGESAIFSDDADDMTGEPPSGAVSVGAFIDYVQTQAKRGVMVPAVISELSSSTVKNAREVEFA